MQFEHHEMKKCDKLWNVTHVGCREHYVQTFGQLLSHQ
jgi:hypothetical protein